jgi:ABC-2 type transport system permease protein
MTGTARSGSPTWWIVFRNEVHALWIGGKAPILLLLFSIVLGAHAFVTAYNVELSLMPPKEMVYETVKTAIAVGTFMGMIIGADAFSGERERGTLEALLLTPTKRREIAIGKLLAALTPWPAALALSIPYMAVLGQGDEVLGPAVLWGALLGTVLTIAYTATGMLVSFWSNTNRTSYLVSLGIYILILLPSQLPGRAQTGAAGQFLQQLNPLSAQNHFLSKILVNNRTVEEWATWLWSPFASAVLAVVLLIVYSAPGLRLEAGRRSAFRQTWRRLASRVATLFVLVTAGLIVTAGISVAAGRQESESSSFQAVNAEAPVQITVNTAYQTVNTGDPIFFDTVVTNPLGEPSPPLIVAMNIINLDQEGDVVDPEDWSPERTQYVEELSPGDSATLSWRVNAILDGDYIVYMVVMPEPAGRDATSQAVASSGIHLTVMPFTRLNPRGILPLVIGAPILLAVGTALTLLIRRRETEGNSFKSAFLRPSVVALGVVVGMGLLSMLAVSSQSAVAGTPAQPGPSVAADPSAEPDESVAVSPSTEPGPSSSDGPSSAASPATVALEIDTSTEPEDFPYAQAALTAPAGSTVTLTLNNRTDADDEIGHNWVLVKPGQEDSVLANGIAAGDDKDWLDVDDPGIIAHTALIEGEDSTSVTFAAPAPGTYTFLCTFPEHYAAGMKGTLTIQ